MRSILSRTPTDTSNETQVRARITIARRANSSQGTRGTSALIRTPASLSCTIAFSSAWSQAVPGRRSIDTHLAAPGDPGATNPWMMSSTAPDTSAVRAMEASMHWEESKAADDICPKKLCAAARKTFVTLASGPGFLDNPPLPANACDSREKKKEGFGGAEKSVSPS